MIECVVIKYAKVTIGVVNSFGRIVWNTDTRPADQPTLILVLENPKLPNGLFAFTPILLT